MVITIFLVYVILLRNKRLCELFTRNNPIEFKQRTSHLNDGGKNI